MPAIHQFVAGFSSGDAISNEALQFRALFRAWGCASDIFCEAPRILPELRRDARNVGDYAAAGRPDDVVLLHLSIGSPVNDVFAGLRCRKALLYHNITPSHYFDAVNRQTAANLARGREQLRALANAAEVNLADSAFNARELADAGYRDVAVLPLVLDFARMAAAPDRKTLRRLKDGCVNVLFVGRCVPNKRIEHALLACHYFRRCVEPHSRFIHVGSFAGTERYYALLLSLARDLGLNDVTFAGAVPQPRLNAFYRAADIFLCMSEHEGFCIPIIESMAHGVPVMAFAAGAVPETLDGAGILVREKRYELIAEMMGRVARDAALRSAVLRGQRERLARYRARDLAGELRGSLAPLLKQD